MTLPTDPDASDDDALQAMRIQLTQRIDSSPQPSLLINRLTAADLRCADAAHHRLRLISRAPRILRVIRAELRKAFELDPDSVLFTEPKPPAVAQKVDTLTDRALQLLVLPSLPINLNHFTAVSLKGDPVRRLPFTPLEALRRVIALNLFGRLAQARRDYWQALVACSWLTRTERWVQLHAQLFADQALVARQLDELSTAGVEMVQALVDAPTAQARQHAGAQWASLRVCKLFWPGVGPRLMAIPGALHLYREGEPPGTPHVIYLPGVQRNYYEYPSFDQLQCGLAGLINGALFDNLWQCLPLRRRHEVCRPEVAAAGANLAVGRSCALQGDALESSALAVLEGQWDNELACAVSINLAQVYSDRREPAVENPTRFLTYIERARHHWAGKARLGSIRHEVQEWDQQRRHKHIIFASCAPELPVQTVQQQVKRYEKGLMTLLDSQDPSADTQGWQDFITLEARFKEQANTLRMLLQGAPLSLFETAFWKARPTGERNRLVALVHSWAELLRSETQLQHLLKLISTAHRDLLVEVLDTPLASKRGGSETCVLSVLVGSEGIAMQPLHSLFAITRTAALGEPERRVPVVLCAFGREGGVLEFARLGALSRGIRASLGSRDGSVLWRYVERKHRAMVAEQVAGRTLAVRYEPIEGNPLALAFKRLLKGYVAQQQGLDGSARVFSETHDVQLSRLLLAVELDEHLNAPASAARAQARAHVELVRKAASAKHQLPSWLADASVAQRNRFRYLQRHYLGSAFAFEEHLKQRLPDLHAYARRVLVARLREDGLQLDIDTPFIELPDHVDGRFCAWESACVVGERGEVLSPSAARTCLSLLQLALQNLDPQMMPTWWRFRYARYLVPAWQPQLTPHYLINMVSSLDIGGRYEALIDGVFYPPASADDARVPHLLRRAVQAGAEADLYSAVQQGLSAEGQRLFSQAMAGLHGLAQHVQLLVVHLVGHTLQHDRYIAGVLVIHDQRSEHCVVYWPTASGAANLSEYASLQLAREHVNRSWAVPGTVKALARHVAPGWAFEAITHHPGDARKEPRFEAFALLPGSALVQGGWRGVEFVRSFAIKHLVPTALVDSIEQQIHEQVAHDAQNWLALVPTSHDDAMALLYRARVLDLQHQAQAGSNSGKTLEKYREQRLGEQSDTRLRAILSTFVPFFGVGNQVYELLLAARRYHRYGDPRDAVDVAFGVIFLAVDLLLSFAPGPKLKAGTLPRPSTDLMVRGLNRIHHSTVAQVGRVSLQSPSPSPAARLTPVQRFKVQGLPHDAVALKGPGERGVYVKSGERFIVDDSHHYPVYRRGDERFLRLKNKEAPGTDELILTIHEPTDWQLGADAPVAGPSSRAIRPQPAPLQPAGWQPSVERAATYRRIQQSSVQGNNWFSWRTRVAENQAFGPTASGICHVHLDPPGFPYDVIYVDGTYGTPAQSTAGYYRLLHQGDHAPLGNIAFIAPDRPLVSKAQVDIGRWTTTDLHEQPIPTSRTATGAWQLHAPLFEGPLEPLVGRAFPGMTRKSREFAVARLIELSDSARSVTASHLLNLRATLDRWLTPDPVRLGQTDDLLAMLRPSDRGLNTLYIGFEGKAPGFTRVDFSPPVALDPSLRAGGVRVSAQRNTAQRVAIRTVLEQQGFNVEELRMRRGRRSTGEWVVTHPRSNRLYYLVYQWVGRGTIQLKTRLTDNWLNAAVHSYSAPPLSAQLRRAMEEQRLVLIAAGIQWPTHGNVPPSVYFARVNRL
ncbi:dermonecrotic toxin domain-containing protein [Pseudomonas sp. S09G 359]|uniref:dermonecrotic toxin domain-containing protein n=1 Tax=Pseudomonas sp. S09G 359 TaxID=2054919 RepID=UPI000C6ED914|nr:DUF6543 domain-containing protein [Pseudomonas sp. S09G 359]AUG09106.1 hypothetical protein CXQ82_21970 [Pseudomonas sp. S09G 359]